jgi:hypothetical protein
MLRKQQARWKISHSSFALFTSIQKEQEFLWLSNNSVPYMLVYGNYTHIICSTKVPVRPRKQLKYCSYGIQ